MVWGLIFRRSFLLSFLLFHVLGASIAYSAPTSSNRIEQHTINGYKVLFVHSPGATAAYLVAFIQTGSSFDDPIKHAGRAHLWEHVIHLGSEKYPTTQVRDAALKRLGATTNASTGLNLVQYYIEVNSSKITQAIDILGNMLTRPAFNQDNFLLEREVVKDEALSYQRDDGTAIGSLMDLYLRPPGHPLGMYDVGTQEQLSAMTLEDLKELYYSDYRPEQVTIILADDFSKPTTDSNALLESIKDSFLPSEVPSEFAHVRPGTEKLFPAQAIIASKPEKPRPYQIEIQSKGDQRILRMTFDTSSDWLTQNLESANILFSFLNSKNEGGLTDRLRKEGLITSAGLGDFRLNNRGLYMYQANLTPLGFERRDRLVEVVLSTIGQIAKGGLDPDLIEYLKSRQIELGKKRISESAQRAAEAVMYSIADGGVTPNLLNLLEYKLRYSSVTPALVAQSAAKLFDPSNMIVGVVAPEVNATKQTDPLFERGIELINDVQVMARWQQAWQTGQLDGKDINLALQISKVPGVYVRPDKDSEAPHVSEPVVVPVKESGALAVFKTDNTTEASGVTVRLYVAPQTLTSAISLGLFVSSFLKDHNAEVDYLHSVGMSFSIGVQGHLEIGASGNPENAIATAVWALQSLKNYVPQPQTLKWAMEKYKGDLLENNSRFAAHLGIQEARTILGKKSGRSLKALQWLERAETTNPGELVRRTTKTLERMDAAVALVGEFHEDSAKELTETIRKHFPKALTQSQRRALTQTEVPIRNVTQYVSDLPGNREIGDIAHVRIWDLSDRQMIAEPKQMAMALVLERMLGAKVFNTNRTEKGLGYVHGATSWTGNKVWLSLYGETRGDDDKQSEILKGWETVFNQIQENTEVQNAQFEDARQGLIEDYSTELTAGQEASTFLRLLNMGRSLDWRLKLKGALEGLTLTDIQNLALVKLGKSAPYLDVKLLGQRNAVRKMNKDCGFFIEGIVTSLRSARASIKGP